MHRAIQQFEINLQSARQLGIVYLAFQDKVTEAIRLDELLRAELVLAVSALDCYVHDIVRIGMTRAFAASGGKPNSFLNFSVSLGFAKGLLDCATAPDKLVLVDQALRRLHGFKTFQTAASISQAISLIGIQEIWKKAGDVMGISPADVKARLDIIVDRRNRIAHEGDIDPTMGIGLKYPIDSSMVRDAVAFLDSVAHAIQDIVTKEIAF